MNRMKSVLRAALNWLGLELVRVPRRMTGPRARHYEPVRPFATYSPWNKDRQFQQVLASIAGFTLVDKYRCFELWTLVEQASRLGAGSLIEIGVWRGGTGALIAKKAKLCGITEKVFLCDTFSGVIKAGAHDTAYRGGEHADTSRRVVEELIATRFRLDNVVVLEGSFPDQTGRDVEHERFRLCHVDVDVYQSAKDIVEWVWDRMVPGGIIVFDDYGFSACDGITKYVEEQALLPGRTTIHNLNGHAVVVKLSDVRGASQVVAPEPRS